MSEAADLSRTLLDLLTQAAPLGYLARSVSLPVELPALDLKTIDHPDLLGKGDIVAQILAPAFTEGWLDIAPLEFTRRLSIWPEDRLRAWGCSVLRAHPWPPGVFIPDFVEWVQSPRFLGQVTLTTRQRRWFAESIGLHARDWWVEKRSITLIAIEAGKGSGKDMFASWVNSYLGYTILLMRNPWFHFNMPVGEPMDVVNVARNQRQARRIYFGKLRRCLRCACFRDILPRRDIRTDEIILRTKLPGTEEPIDCVRLVSLNSQNEAAEGNNTLAFVLDEFDSFVTADGNSNADAMLDTVTTSSRFRSRQLGIIITYTRSLSGPMKRIVKRCGNLGGENPMWWGDSAPSWEVLPWRTYMPVTIDGVQLWTNHTGMELIVAGRTEEAKTLGMVNDDPDDSMRRYWATDQMKFWSIYGCRPPAAVDAYIQMPEKITQAVEMGAEALLEPLASISPQVIHRINSRTGKVHEWVAFTLGNWRPRPGVTYFIGGDPGESGDSFGLAVYHIIPPAERGYICPKCWAESIFKRMTKHYIPEPLPTREEEPNFRPSDWACDWCQGQPRYQEVQRPTIFWGVARASGQPWIEDVVTGYDASGAPIYETEDVLVYDEESGTQHYSKRNVTREVYLPVVVEDLLIEWMPDRVHSRSVSFENVRDCIWEIAKRVRVGAAAFDKWQSTMMVQSLISGDPDQGVPGIDAESLFPSNPAQMEWYGNGKTLLMEAQTWLQENRPDNPAYEHHRVQWSEIQLVNGSKIDHPEESRAGGPGGKDLTDAAELAKWLCVRHETSRGIIDSGRSPGEAYMERTGRIELDEVNPDSVIGQTIMHGMDR